MFTDPFAPRQPRRFANMAEEDAYYREHTLILPTFARARAGLDMLLRLMSAALHLHLRPGQRHNHV